MTSRHQPTITPVVSSRGAPMGRACWSAAPTERCHLFRVALSVDGYDSGGAYWGTPSSNLWCVTDGQNFRWFCRAPSRLEAWRLIQDEWSSYDIRLKKPIALGDRS